MSAVLKLVESQAFAEELRLSPEEGAQGSHSLQSAFQYCSPWKPFLAKYVIERFSKRGQVVLDPVCSTGIVGVEACLAGRSFIGAADNHGLVRLTQARLFPADLGEVALRLQFVPFKRPVDIRGFTGAFPAYFDSDTYRELINLKNSLRQTRDAASEFIMFTVATILHGHTSGHLSAYSSPSEGLAPDAQLALNKKRGETPPYRPVSGRVIKKAASLLRDGVPSALQGREDLQRQVVYSEPSAIEGVQTGTVDLAMATLNQPGFFHHGMHSWLRTWWLGVDLPQEISAPQTVEDWRNSANEVLLEMARVVRPGGRLVVRCGQGRIHTKTISYRREFETIVTDCLNRFWRVEGSISERYVGQPRQPGSRSSAQSGELLVLRRR
jgi:hypothetical protein